MRKYLRLGIAALLLLNLATQWAIGFHPGGFSGWCLGQTGMPDPVKIGMWVLLQMTLATVALSYMLPERS